MVIIGSAFLTWDLVQHTDDGHRSVANEFIPESRKGEGMGYFVMSTNLGVVFGPLLALTVVQFTSFKVLFGLLAVIISIGLIFSFMLKITELAKPRYSGRKIKIQPA